MGFMPKAGFLSKRIIYFLYIIPHMKKSIFLLNSGLAAIAATAISCTTPACVVENPVYEGPAVTELTHETFDDAISNSLIPAVVDFYNPRCGYCVQMKPIYEKVCEDMRGEINCFTFNTDQDRQMEDRIPARYDVRAIPAYRFFCSGVENAEKRAQGARSEDNLKALIEDFLEVCQ